MGAFSKLLSPLGTSKSTLHIATLNVSGIGGITKRKALNDFLSKGDIDVLMVTETMIYEGQEITKYIDGFRGFYASIKPKGRVNEKGTLIRAKWGTAIFVRDGIKVGSIERGKKILEGRVITVACAFEGMTKPLHLAAIYAPVDKDEQPNFWLEFEKWADTYIPENELAIVGGDLNDHFLGAKVERWPVNPDASSVSSSGAKATLAKLGFTDTIDINGDFDIQKHHTFTHHGGTITRLDYILAREGLSLKAHRTFNCDKVSTGHRVVKLEVDLEPQGASITHAEPFQYAMPIKFDKNPNRVALFGKKEEAWLNSFEENEIYKLGQGPEKQRDFIEQHQVSFISKLEDLCVKQAEEVWPSVHSGKKGAVRSKEAGIIVGTVSLKHQKLVMTHTVQANLRG